MDQVWSQFTGWSQRWKLETGSPSFWGVEEPVPPIRPVFFAILRSDCLISNSRSSAAHLQVPSMRFNWPDTRAISKSVSKTSGNSGRA